MTLSERIDAAVRAPRFSWAAHSVRGARADNQDSVVLTSPDQFGLVAARGVLAVVCDGIGGEDGGAIASSVAASTAMRVFYASGAEDDTRAICRAMQAANHAVKEAAVDHRLARMGTTLVMAIVSLRRVTVGYVGDSRAYLYSPDQELRLLTRDHIGEDCTGLTHSLGAIGRSDGDVLTAHFCPGARLLLCTDGLHRALSEADLTAHLSRHSHVTTIAHDLVANAYSNNSRDNITAAVIACDDVVTRVQSAIRAIRRCASRWGYRLD